jgi:hypothetical protein
MERFVQAGRPRGQLTIDGVVTAEVDDDGSLVPTGECP